MRRNTSAYYIIVHKRLLLLFYLHQFLVYILLCFLLLLLLLPIFLHLTKTFCRKRLCFIVLCDSGLRCCRSVWSFRALINSLVWCLSTQRERGEGRRNRTYTEWEVGWVSAITKHKICYSSSFYSELYCIYSGRIKYLKKEKKEEVEKKKKKPKKPHPTHTHKKICRQLRHANQTRGRSTTEFAPELWSNRYNETEKVPGVFFLFFVFF